jgi:hypothetical protein
MTGTTPVPGHAPAVTPCRRVRHRLRSYACGQPLGYLAFARRRYTGHNVEVIGPGTELVIDGFTRSATTFAVYAFQLAQDAPVRLAHHLHAPAQLIEAARRGIPAVALIREPQGAILSQLIQEPDVALPDALFAYSRFYQRLMPYRERLVIGEFKQVTNDFGAVIRQLNERFGTHFAEFAHTDANVRQCFELSDLRETMAPGLLGFESGLVSRDQLRRELESIRGAARKYEQESWVPSAKRDRAKEALRDQWRQPSLARLRGRAELAYQEFLAGAGPTEPHRRDFGVPAG